MTGSDGTPGKSLAYKMKENVVATSLLALGSAFEIVSKYSPEMKAEIADLPDGQIVCMGVFSDGPSMSLQKKDDRIVYLGKGIKNPDFVIYFKNIDSAFMTLTGQIGAHTASVEHRTILHGNLAIAMLVSRAMAIVQKYLMPSLILKKGSKRAPKYTTSQLLVKGKVMGTLVAGMMKNMSK